MDRIHQLRLVDGEHIKRRLIHGDIRPENILLMKGPSGSPYEFTPKIADFDVCHRSRTIFKGSDLEPYGNQQFSE